MRKFMKSISGAASVEAVLLAGLIGTAIVAGSTKMNDDDKPITSPPTLTSTQDTSTSK